MPRTRSFSRFMTVVSVLIALHTSPLVSAAEMPEVNEAVSVEQAPLTSSTPLLPTAPLKVGVGIYIGGAAMLHLSSGLRHWTSYRARNPNGVEPRLRGSQPSNTTFNLSLAILTVGSLTTNIALWRQISRLPKHTRGRVAAAHTGLMLLEFPLAFAAVLFSFGLDREYSPVFTPLFMAVPFSAHLLSAQLVRNATASSTPLASDSVHNRATIAVGPGGLAVRW